MISVPLWLLILLSCLAIPTALLILMIIIGLIWTTIESSVSKRKNKQECPYKLEERSDK